jgi:hypothetical protein
VKIAFSIEVLRTRPGRAALLLLLLAVLIGVVAAWMWPRPHIVIEPPSRELGEQPQQHLELAYTVRNEGSAALKIDSVTTTCGCTKAAVQEELVPPGGSTELKVTMDPQQDNLAGSLFRIVFIRSNDPRTPQAEAQFHVTITKP